MTRQIPIALACTLLAGCYNYAAIQPAAAAPGQVLRVDLSSAGTARLATLVGPYAARAEGIVRAADDSGLTLSVSEIVRKSGVPERWSAEAVRFAPEDLEVAERKTLSRTRTVAVAVLALGTATIAAMVTHSGNATSTGTPGSPPTGR
jgi:hypothetical protein